MSEAGGAGQARALEVLATGPLALIEDEGRTGSMALGVGRAGAVDRGSYRLGERLVGNPPGCAAIEVTFGGLSVRAHGDLTVCLTGAPAPAAIGDRAVGPGSPLRLPDGAVLTLGAPAAGMRTYLCVRGGIDVDPVLGSRSTDTMSGLGPGPLSTRQLLPVGTVDAAHHAVDQAPTPLLSSDPFEIAVLPGPRRDWFADPRQLARADGWVITERSDRKGVRLEGDPIERAPGWESAELPSEGVVRGAIQVPPDGRPVIFLDDHPVTGGYPVIGVVRCADVDRVAQGVPGQRIIMRWQA